MESIDGMSLGAQYLALSFVRWDSASDETLIHLLDLDELRYLGSESVSAPRIRRQCRFQNQRI